MLVTVHAIGTEHIIWTRFSADNSTGSPWKPQVSTRQPD